METKMPSSWKRWFSNYWVETTREDGYVCHNFLPRFRLKFWLLNTRADGSGFGLRSDGLFWLSSNKAGNPRWMWLFANSKIRERWWPKGVSYSGR